MVQECRPQGPPWPWGHPQANGSWPGILAGHWSSRTSRARRGVGHLDSTDQGHLVPCAVWSCAVSSQTWGQRGPCLVRSARNGDGRPRVSRSLESYSL